MDLGYNMYTVYKNFNERGYGSFVLFTGVYERLLSRLSYLTTRNIIYKLIYDQRKPKKWRNDLTPKEKAVISGFAGAVGAIVSNYFECCYVRRVGDLGRVAKF